MGAWRWLHYSPLDARGSRHQSEGQVLVNIVADRSHTWGAAALHHESGTAPWSLELLYISLRHAWTRRSFCREIADVVFAVYGRYIHRVTYFFASYDLFPLVWLLNTTIDTPSNFITIHPPPATCPSCFYPANCQYDRPFLSMCTN